MKSVESRTGAVTLGRGGNCLPAAFASTPVAHSRPWFRFPSPLIEPDVRISRIRLSDQVLPQGMREFTSTRARLMKPSLSLM
jgi:hypothetical protein